MDKDGKCIQANAIGIGTGLLFSAPQLWKADFTEALHEAKRIQPVTLQEFRQKGARYFCWVHAGETLEASKGPDRTWTVSQHGAFIYLFSENPLERNANDIYFSIEPGTGKDSDLWYMWSDSSGFGKSVTGV